MALIANLACWGAVLGLEMGGSIIASGLFPAVKSQRKLKSLTFQIFWAHVAHCGSTFSGAADNLGAGHCQQACFVIDSCFSQPKRSHCTSTSDAPYRSRISSRCNRLRAPGSCRRPGWHRTELPPGLLAACFRPCLRPASGDSPIPQPHRKTRKIRETGNPYRP